MSLRSNLVWIMNHVAFRKKPFGGDEAQNSQILIQDSQKCRDCGFQLCVNWISLHYVARSQFDYKPKRCTGPNPSKMSIHLHPFALFDPPKWVFEWSLQNSTSSMKVWDLFVDVFLSIFTQLKTVLAVWREQCWLSTRARQKNLFRQRSSKTVQTRHNE